MKKIIFVLSLFAVSPSMADGIVQSSESVSIENIASVDSAQEQNFCRAETYCRSSGRTIWCWARGGRDTTCRSQNGYQVFCEVWGDRYDSAVAYCP